MGRRRTFVVVAATVLVIAFVALVVRPGVERGGIQEVLIIGAIFVGLLGLERYLRAR